MPYEIYETETFTNLYEAMEKEEQNWVDKIKVQLRDNPKVGKPLKFEWFREKKFGNKRLYYLIYENLIRYFLLLLALKKINRRLLIIY